MDALHITTRHTGKMTGMQSLSTCCRTNHNCMKFSQVEGSVCQKCYAMKMTKMYQNLVPCLEKNTEILTKEVLIKEQIPTINASFFRLEAFGDLINTTQVVNYFKICKANPYTHFALWTKVPHLIQEAIDQGEEKPDNLKIIVSSLFMNKVYDSKMYDFIDKIFTVYDKDYIKENDVQINCGGKRCLECKLCYTDNDVFNINEKVK